MEVECDSDDSENFISSFTRWDVDLLSPQPSTFNSNEEMSACESGD